MASRIAEGHCRLLFSGLLQQGSCGVRVTHRYFLIKPEDFGEVERVRALDHSLFELPVDAESLQSRGLPAHGGADPVVAGTVGPGGGLVVDQQMAVRRVRPPLTSVVQPVQQQ
ncbi:hypothetical protein [Embleya sp. NPDC005575]|uniref:hypothetical protein n=1 Tax=Embleya sp. NPDC005575 TaxID=3156892 RepID=UPI0033A1E371